MPATQHHIPHSAHRRAYLELHIAVLLFGFTAILGDLIQLSALMTVWWRVLITSISLLFLIRFGRQLKQIPRKNILQFMSIGVLVALHWLCFFGSIKYSNASICLICLATTSFFTAILEPLILGHRIKSYELLLGFLIIPGMMIVANSIDFTMLTGIWLGLLSALLAALFAIFNKKLIHSANPFSITFLELGSGWIFLSLLLPVFFTNSETAQFWPGYSDWIYLLVLALLCTTLGYVLALRALRYLSAFAANLTINLEPVYGIILAWLILNESDELTAGFYWGSCIILFAVIIYPVINKKMINS